MQWRNGEVSVWCALSLWGERVCVVCEVLWLCGLYDDGLGINVGLLLRVEGQAFLRVPLMSILSVF